MGAVEPPPIGLIACAVFEPELAAHAAGADHIRKRQVLEIALHDRPTVMRAALQAALDAFDAVEGIEAVVLLYGLCGGGSAGLQAGRHPVVIPSAHDCISVFLGCPREHERQIAGRCYFYTEGWNRARRVPGPDRVRQIREELSARFDAEQVEYLLEMERGTWEHYRKATFIDTGTPRADAEADYTAACARDLGWDFERLPGNLSLFRDALWGRWDENRFVVVRPGQMLAQAPDHRILKPVPAA